MIQRYTKKPVTIEAIQFTENNGAEVSSFVGKDWMWSAGRYEGIIYTLEGNHSCLVGDYVIKGVKGEFYPCKPDIFDLTYEIAKD